MTYAIKSDCKMKKKESVNHVRKSLLAAELCMMFVGYYSDILKS